MTYSISYIIYLLQCNRSRFYCRKRSFKKRITTRN